MNFPPFQKPNLKIQQTGQLKALLLSLLLVLLLMALLVMCVQRNDMAHTLSTARNAIGDSLYNSLYMFCQTFDQIGIPTIDPRTYVLPHMREYFYAANAQSDALLKGFGKSYAVLDSALSKRITQAFEAFETAYANGGSTDQARADLAACVTQIRTILDKRFASGVLVPA